MADNHLLMLIGILIVAIVAVELVPMPQLVQSAPAPVSVSPALPPPPMLSSGVMTSANVISTNALVTLTVTKG